MPSMRFERYLADSGAVHPIRIKQATYNAISGTIPTGDVTSQQYVKVSKSKREFGISPRGIVIARTIQVDADSFNVYATLPICDPADWESGTGGYQVGNNVSYNGATWRIVSKIPESAR